MVSGPFVRQQYSHKGQAVQTVAFQRPLSQLGWVSRIIPVSSHDAGENPGPRGNHVICRPRILFVIATEPPLAGQTQRLSALDERAIVRQRRANRGIIRAGRLMFVFLYRLRRAMMSTGASSMERKLNTVRVSAHLR